MTRVALLCLLAALLLAGCAMPPGAAEQIRSVVREEADALAHGDSARLYRLHDPDFRAVCPYDRFRSLPHTPEMVLGVREIETRGVRGWATVELAGGTSERRTFIQDAGRWYIYADRCGD